MSQVIVSLLSCGSYDPEQVFAAIQEACEKASCPDVRGKVLLLKPNLLSGSLPEQAVTTHPVFVASAVRYFLGLGAKEVWVGDSPGYHGSESAAKKSGLWDAVQEAGGIFVPFLEESLLENPQGKLVKAFRVASAVLKADLVFSLAKMKTHSLMGYTGALKNLFGVIPGLNKGKFHLRFPKRELFAAMIVDLCEAVAPHFSLMDGILAMEGPGPGSGYPRKTGLVAASQDPLALDLVISRLMGYDPETLPIHAEALKRKRWVAGMKEVKVSGLSLEQTLIQDFLKVPVLKEAGFQDRIPRFIYPLVKNLLVPLPVFLRKKCIFCMECVGICPAGALSLDRSRADRKKIALNRKACIRCYCCHEVCPAHAIDLKRQFI